MHFYRNYFNCWEDQKPSKLDWGWVLWPEANLFSYGHTWPYMVIWLWPYGLWPYGLLRMVRKPAAMNKRPLWMSNCYGHAMDERPPWTSSHHEQAAAMNEQPPWTSSRHERAAAMNGPPPWTSRRHEWARLVGSHRHERARSVGSHRHERARSVSNHKQSRLP
jgi:hypothetical protein